MYSFDNLLSKIKDNALNKREQGYDFEQIVKDYLLNDSVQKEQYKKVELWKDWVDKEKYNFPNNDTGIDLVAYRSDGGITAVQAKFYNEGSNLNKKSIDSFIATGNRKPFTHLLVIETTGKNWTENLQSEYDNQKNVITQKIGLSDLRNSNIDWNKYIPKSYKIESKPKKELRPHQKEAVNNVITEFNKLKKSGKTDMRGQIIMACGTGKTFTSLKIAETLTKQIENDENRSTQILFLVPSLSLVQQTLKEWCNETQTTMHPFAVCSDEKIGRNNNAQDVTKMSKSDLLIPPTTNKDSLIKGIDKNNLQKGMRVIFSTYQSISVINDAQKDGMSPFDLIIADEAHRTTGVTLSGNSESEFTKVHNSQFLMADRRLYMTATPRVYNDNVKRTAIEKDAV
jgi:predicted helicase